MPIHSRLTNVAARIRDTLFGRTDQPEHEQRERTKAEARHRTANAQIERLADLQNDPTMQGYLDRGDGLVARERRAAAKPARQQSRDGDRDYGR